MSSPAISSLPDLKIALQAHIEAQKEAINAQGLPEPDSFHQAVRNQEWTLFQGCDCALPTPEQVQRMEEIVTYWEVGDAVHFFDLAAMDVLQSIDNLIPEDRLRKLVRNNFIKEIQRMNSFSQVEQTRYELPDEELDGCLESFDRFTDSALRIIRVSVKSPTSEQTVEINKLETTLRLMSLFFSEPLSRALLGEVPIDFYLKSIPKVRDSKAHQARYLELIQAVSPKVQWPMPPREMLALPPAQFYGILVDSLDAAYREFLDPAKKMERAEIGGLSKRMQMLDDLKYHFETIHLKRNRSLIQERALDNIRLYFGRSISCSKKSDKKKLVQAYKQILARLNAKLGADFESRMQNIVESGNFQAGIRILGNLDSFPGIMRDIKREIKQLHARVIAGEFGDAQTLREKYIECFESLLSLFTIVHDLSALRNANLYQLQKQNLPPDLLDYADLELEEADASSPVPIDDAPSEAVPSPRPPAPSTPSAEDLFPPSPRKEIPEDYTERKVPVQGRDQAAFIRLEAPPKPSRKKQPVDLPNEGESCSKVGRFLLREGFHLFKNDDHRYFRHFQFPHIVVKIKKHGNFTGGERQAMKKALEAIQAQQL